MTGDFPPLLLQELLAMRIEEPGAFLTFEQALAAEQGWSRARAEEVSAEYRRFLYLAATSGREVTPSLAVDKAWHLHLTHSRHYWEELCGSLLGRPLHHRPSSGGAVESDRYQRQYEDTLALYEATFGKPPPPSVWPRRSAPLHPHPEGKGQALWRARDAAWAASVLLVSAGAGLWGGALAALTAAAVMLVGWLVVPAAAAEMPQRRETGACGGGGGGWSGDCGDGAGCGGGGCGGCGGG